MANSLIRFYCSLALHINLLTSNPNLPSFAPQDGVYFAIKHGARSMLKNPAKEGKSIIVISSTAGYTGQFGLAYTASKFAVRGLTKHAAAYLARHGIRVNSVHVSLWRLLFIPFRQLTDLLFSYLINPFVGWLQPNFIRTSLPAPFFNRSSAPLTRPQIASIASALQNASPARRMGTPEEVAFLVVYLASDESSFTTGTEHVLDGGFLTVAGYSENPFKVRGKM